MRPRLLVATFAACTCALVGIGAGLLGAAGYYEPGDDPDRCAIESTPSTEAGSTGTYLSNSVGRVWVKEYYGKRDRARYERWYACRNHAGRHVFLASTREASYEDDEAHPRSYISIRPEGLEGATVGFVKVTCSNIHRSATCSSKLRVVRLDREGGEARPPITRRHAIIDAPFLTASRSRSSGLMYYVVAKRTGNVVAAPTGSSFCANGCELHRVSRHGTDRVIDSGTDLRLASMMS